MLQEILKLLTPEGEGYILDGTFGGGGHTSALLATGPDVRVVAFDADPEAIPRSEEVQAAFPDRLKFYSQNFSEIEQLEEANFTGVLFDLGVSSFQLDTPERGFSFRAEGPADMRLNPREGRSAAVFLERAREDELTHAIRDLGEEPQWRKVVTAIVQARGTGKLATTQGLVEVITEAIGPRIAGRRSKLHPATLTFQGIRMEINRELDHLEAALPAAYAKLAIGGVMAVITFHSLEDRIVKRFFKRLAGRPEHKWDATPQEERTAVATLLTNRPWVPSDEEVKANPRSRSAKVRAIRKLIDITSDAC